MINRRKFISKAALAVGATSVAIRRSVAGESNAASDLEREARALMEAHRPSRLTTLPNEFRERVGATHVDGKYCFTKKPFLIEGAEKLLELGTRLGKFYFTPANPKRDYPFNSQWPSCRTFVELAKTEHYQQLFALPLSTFILTAHSAFEGGWKEQQPKSFYDRVTEDFYELAAHFYRLFAHRRVTVVLQHWEGDWLLRGQGGELWNPPPAAWKRLCEQMQKWLAARQAGVTRARAEQSRKTVLCRVVHATEVNRVLDMAKGVPTMTEHVLPGVELDLISYSSYDALNDPLTLYNSIRQIKTHAKTTGIFGDNPVYVGEIGIPENEKFSGLADRWDRYMGAALAAGAQFVVHWQLYCNELNRKLDPQPSPPVKHNEDVRGFFLVRPDGSLSEAGRYFQGLWRKA